MDCCWYCQWFCSSSVVVCASVVVAFVVVCASVVVAFVDVADAFAVVANVVVFVEVNMAS